MKKHITTATWLTLSRLVFLPFILWALSCGTIAGAWIAVILYALGSFTDFIDGYVARKFNQVTALGTFLDPIIDKVYVAALFLMLIQVGYIDGIWIALPILILSREFLISGLREFLGPHKIEFPVTKLAKWKTTSQMVSIGFLLATPLWDGFYLIGLGLLSVATYLTLITGWRYFETGLEHMAKMD